jgi:hypothetical protein
MRRQHDAQILAKGVGDFGLVLENIERSARQGLGIERCDKAISSTMLPRETLTR